MDHATWMQTGRIQLDDVGIIVSRCCDGAHSDTRRVLTYSSMFPVDQEHIAPDLLLTDLSGEAKASLDQT